MSRELDYKNVPWCPSYPVDEIVQIKTGTWRALAPVVTEEKCIKCKLCYWWCPDSAISITEKGAKVDYNFCKGCGICANECPVGAINMVREEMK